MHEEGLLMMQASSDIGKEQNNHEGLRCVCGNEGVGSNEKKNGVPIVSCSKCGILRQDCLPFRSKKEWEDFYRFKYVAGSIHTYEHDRKVALVRWNTYQLFKIFGSLSSIKLLDIGSGNGAWIDECRTRGIDAVGCDVGAKRFSTYPDSFYDCPFEDVGFPTSSFDVVTCHDVLEHVWDPMLLLNEVFRVLKYEGLFILDFPNFFSSYGKHHWRLIEHIWFFSADQLEKILKSIGFEIVRIFVPIPGKVLFICRKPSRDKLVSGRLKIAFPPGIGDILWSLTKVQGLVRDYCRNGNERSLKDIPLAYIVCPHVSYAGLNENEVQERRRRGLEFIWLYPFLEGVDVEVFSDEKDYQAWWKAYGGKRSLADGDAHHDSIVKGAFGKDYFVCMNRSITNCGMSLQDIYPQYGCEWNLKMFRSIKRQYKARSYLERYGRYGLLYLSGDGMFKFWLKHLGGISRIVDAIENLISNTKFAEKIDHLILVGKSYDFVKGIHDGLWKRYNAKVCSLLNQTSLEELLGLIDSCKFVFGWPSGITVLSTVLRKPTAIIWDDKYFVNSSFYVNCVPVESVGDWYFPVTVSDIISLGMGKKIESTVMDLIANKQVEEKKT